MTIETKMKSRLLNQQSTTEGWNGFIEAIADFFADYVSCVVSLQTETLKDTAEGVWLDRAGEIVGMARPAAEETERVFRCRDSSDPDYDELHGFGNWMSAENSHDGTEYGNYSLGGLIWSFATGIPVGTGQASDEDYLPFIDAKIAATNADASIPGIAKFITNGFGIDSTITDAPGKVYIQLDGEVDLRQRRILGNIIPVIAGVGATVTNWPDWS